MKSAIIKKRFPISVSGIDANTSIITLTLTNLIPFSAHSSNFLKIDIAWHLSFTEIISFSNTLNHSQRTHFILFKSGTEKEDAPSQGTLSLFKEPVSEIQCFHLTAVCKLPI